MNHNFRRLTDLFNYIHIEASHIYHSQVGTEWCFNDYCNSFNRIYIVLDGGGLLYNENERTALVPSISTFAIVSSVPFALFEAVIIPLAPLRTTNPLSGHPHRAYIRPLSRPYPSCSTDPRLPKGHRQRHYHTARLHHRPT